MSLTADQLQQMAEVKRMAPYCVVWVMLDKDTGEFTVYASPDMRQPNKAARQGHTVFTAAHETTRGDHHA